MKSINLFACITLLLFAKESNSQCDAYASYNLNGSAQDSESLMLHGVNTNVTNTTDRFSNSNSAYAFNGTSSQIEFPVDFDLNTITINLWFKAESSNTLAKTIFDNDHPALNNGSRKIYVINNGSNPGVNFSTGAGTTNVHSETINLNQWYMATMVVDTDVKYYLDGNLVATFALNASNTTSGSQFAHLGCTRLFDRYFDGDIDDFSVYNCALNQTSIDSLFNLTGNCNAYASYNLNGNTLDSESLSLHATNNGASLTSDQFGNANSAYAFDGSSSQIEFPVDFDLNTCSINLWFKAESSSTQPKTIFDNDHPGLVNGSRKIYVLDNGSNPGVNFSTGAGTTNVHSELIDLNEWYMATMVVGADVKYYLNANLVATFALHGSNSTSGSLFAHLGCTRLFDRFFDGDIDEFSVYNCDLDQSEIDELYSIVNSTDDLISYENSIKIYPNPTSNDLNLDLPKDFKSGSFEIFDVTGKLVKSDNLNGSNLNVSFLNSGIYFLQINIDGIKYNQKFIKN